MYINLQSWFQKAEKGENAISRGSEDSLPAFQRQEDENHITSTHFSSCNDSFLRAFTFLCCLCWLIKLNSARSRKFLLKAQEEIFTPNDPVSRDIWNQKQNSALISTFCHSNRICVCSGTINEWFDKLELFQLSVDFFFMTQWRSCGKVYFLFSPF